MRILRWAGRFWTAVLAITVALVGVLIGARLLLPLFGSTPALNEASPPNGADAIPTHAQLTFRFNGPMNPRSVEQALRISPPVAWVPIWSADRATLTISPTEALQPDTSYLLALDQRALSQQFHPLEQPIELRFHTALAPEVVAVLPAADSSAVPLDSPISISFSRTIVPSDTLMQARPLPELQFEPPIAGSAIWLDQATVLFRPSAPLQPGTRYHAALAATLADVAGGQLSKPFEWNFSTAPPQVLAVAPLDGERLVMPRPTLALTISQPLAIESLRAGLIFSPTITGQLATSNLPDGRQLISYRPDRDLQPDTTYTATLQAGALPANGNLPLGETVRWSFTTAPRPALIGRFPGEGQTLPAEQDIRLVFTTPMDSNIFSATLQIDPPADLLGVASNNTEIRLSADLRAATVYTITLPASLADRNGIALGQEYQIRFVTAPPGPTLELPEVSAHVAQIAPGQPASLLIRRTNISGLNIAMFRLDEPAVVRMLSFGEADWPAFQPERYSLQQLRSWQVPIADQLNRPTEEPIPLVGPADPPLEAGAYYLRLQTLEGPRADLLLLVARARLTIENNGREALVWATDIISGTPVDQLAIALYQAGALVRQGTTGPDGLLRFADLNPQAAAATIALAGGAPFSGAGKASRSIAVRASPQFSLFVTADRTVYRAGEVAQIAGIVRAAVQPTGTLALPPSIPISLSVRPSSGVGKTYRQTLAIGASGVFSASVPLASDLAPGSYIAAAAAGGVLRQISFTIAPAAPAPLLIAIDTPAPLVAGEAAPIAITVRAQGALPAAGATISWTLDAERMPVAGDNMLFGDDEQDQAPIAQRSGSGQADANGDLSLLIADLAGSDVPLRYRLVVRAADPSGASAAASGTFIVAPAQRSVGLRLPSAIFTIGKPGAIEVLALTPDGQPAPHTTVRAEVYQRDWPAGAAERQASASKPRDRLLFTRSATTGADGWVSLPITLSAGGVYRLQVSAAGQPAYSAATIWASGPGFSGWGALPGAPLLIADRPAYRPGETATLLVTSPFAQASALIVRSGSAGAEGQIRALRAGSTFTITVQPSDAPGLPVSVFLATQARRPAATVGELPPLPVARAVLPVIADRQNLNLTISNDRGSYLPGATATLTITTSTADGIGVPADLILDVVAAEAAPAGQISAASALPPQPPLAPAEGQPPASTAGSATRLWAPALRTNANGVVSATLRLPPEPAQLRVLAWAATAEQAGEAQSTLVVTRPLSLRLAAPPSFRAGDQIEIAAFVENAEANTQEVAVALAGAGFQALPATALNSRVQIAPGQTSRVAWRVRVLDAARLRLAASAQVGDQPPQTAQIEQVILPGAQPPSPRNTGIALLREYLDPLSGQPLNSAKLAPGQLVRARLTIVSLAAHRNLIVQEPLPANALLVASPAGTFEQAQFVNRQIELRQTSVGPGIMRYEYLFRIVAAGSYTAPAPTARASDGASGAGNPIQIEAIGDKRTAGGG